ncbi:hypothetical protein [Umezakia ovalisporum]|uniref:hypothetical protein n=1 Tax=Umezakia ovalisporum TaxID=75695 RepID=UPI0035BA496E
MATTKIYDLYPTNTQQLFHEITEREMRQVKARERSIITPIVTDVNEQSLANVLDQNLNNLLFNLRGQMNAALSNARMAVNEEFNFL